MLSKQIGTNRQSRVQREELQQTLRPEKLEPKIARGPWRSMVNTGYSLRGPGFRVVRHAQRGAVHPVCGSAEVTNPVLYLAALAMRHEQEE